VRESEELIDDIRDVANESIEICIAKHTTDWSTLKNALKNSVAKYIYEKTKRNPMILPIIEEV